MNKNNLLKVLITLVVFIVLTVPLIYSVLEEGAGVGSTADVETDLKFEVIDGISNLKDKTGKVEVTEECDIEIAGGTIPNIESGTLVVEDGNPVSGKLVFSADSSFDLDDKHITVPKDGYIEFKDGKIIVSKDTTIEVDDTKIEAEIDGTEIKIEENFIEVKGHVSIDYETSPAKIILSGKDSILELQTEEKEKIEFKNLDDKDIIINIGSFHKSEDCKEKNCISYQEMGIGMSGEEWNKLKIDGNAIITKHFNEETIYKIKFEDGEAELYRDLSKLKDTEFSKKTVINYNSGDITFFIETSEKRAEEINKGRINIGKGIIDVEFYDDKDIQLAISSEAVLEESIQEQIYPKPVSDIPNQLKEKANEVYVDGKTLSDIIKEITEKKGKDIMSEELILAWINQESSMSQDAELGGCFGFTQISLIALKDLIQNNPGEYGEYKDYTNEELINALMDDGSFNIEAGIDYLNLIKTRYKLSQEEVKANYGYTNSEEDILLMAYNAGPTVTKDILTGFKNTGGGNWDELEEFLHTDEALSIFKKYKESYGIKDTDTEEEANSKLEWKINVVIKYIKNIKSNANQ